MACCVDYWVCVETMRACQDELVHHRQVVGKEDHSGVACEHRAGLAAATQVNALASTCDLRCCHTQRPRRRRLRGASITQQSLLELRADSPFGAGQVTAEESRHVVVGHRANTARRAVLAASSMHRVGGEAHLDVIVR